MKEFPIQFQNVEEINRLVTLNSTQPFEIDICGNRHLVDGKSLLGVTSMSIEQPLIVKIYTDSPHHIASYERALSQIFH